MSGLMLFILIYALTLSAFITLLSKPYTEQEKLEFMYAHGITNDEFDNLIYYTHIISFIPIVNTVFLCLIILGNVYRF